MKQWDKMKEEEEKRKNEEGGEGEEKLAAAEATEEAVESLGREMKAAEDEGETRRNA